MLWNTVKTQEVEQKEQAQPDRSRQVLEEAANSEYKYGFTSDIATLTAPVLFSILLPEQKRKNVYGAPPLNRK